jgi:hypothetical protein
MARDVPIGEIDSCTGFEASRCEGYLGVEFVEG